MLKQAMGPPISRATTLSCRPSRPHICLPPMPFWQPFAPRRTAAPVQRGGYRPPWHVYAHHPIPAHPIIFPNSTALNSRLSDIQERQNQVQHKVDSAGQMEDAHVTAAACPTASPAAHCLRSAGAAAAAWPAAARDPAPFAAPWPVICQPSAAAATAPQAWHPPLHAAAAAHPLLAAVVAAAPRQAAASGWRTAVACHPQPQLILLTAASASAAADATARVCSRGKRATPCSRSSAFIDRLPFP